MVPWPPGTMDDVQLDLRITRYSTLRNVDQGNRPMIRSPRTRLPILVLVLQKAGGAICFMFTDVNLAGSMSGADLAGFAASHYPNMKIIVTSGNSAPSLPKGTTFLPKPWKSLDLLRVASEACHH
jgi:hypothetical protein